MPKDGVCYVCGKTNLRNLYILSLMNVDRACVYELISQRFVTISLR